MTSPTSHMTIWLWGKRPGPAVLTFAVSWSGPLTLALQAIFSWPGLADFRGSVASAFCCSLGAGGKESSREEM